MSSECGRMDFKDIVHHWIELHDEIKQIQGVVRSKRAKMNQMQHHIILFMKENNKEICNVGESNALVMKQRKSSGTIKKDDVMKLLMQHSKMNTEQASECTKTFYDERPAKFKDYIHLTGI